MTHIPSRCGRIVSWIAVGLLLAVAAGAGAQTPAPAADPGAPSSSSPQPAAADKPSMTIYGFAMVDFGQNFKTIDPNWFDTMRITKLPSYQNQFGKDNSTFAGVRQTRFGVKTSSPTDAGVLAAKFEIDMFGTGADAGQTTIRLRHAWGEFGQFGAGQTDSPFEDGDIWPNSLDYWGPTGMVFFRNVQLRWTPMSGDDTLMLAIERPGASGDGGVYADRIEIQNITGRNSLPDFTGAFKHSAKAGYFRVGWALRKISWDDNLADKYELSGSAIGWGLNFTSNINASKNDVVRLGFVYGQGIQNYMQDSPVDIGIQLQPSNPVTPVTGKALPIVGIVAFLDHNWNAKFSSAMGYSSQVITNSDGQAPNAFHAGYYALGNVLYTPVANLMVGGEFQWGRRVNNSDGWSYDDFKIQFSVKYNFSHTLGGQ